MKTILVATLAALASSAAHADTVFHPLIVGGETVPPATKTYMVGLRDTKDGISYCGGSLITPKHVLTAAHCAKSAYKFAAVGTHFLEGTQDGEQLKISSFKLHPQYNFSDLSYDLAVLTLASASKFTPVSLSASDITTFVGKTSTAMGWGTLSDEADASPELRRVDLKVLSKKDCLGAGLSRAPDATMFCAGGKYWKDTCSGDSGGPVIIEDKKNGAGDLVIGVVSWGDSCGVKGKPSVYASVAKGADFIKAAAPGAKFV